MTNPGTLATTGGFANGDQSNWVTFNDNNTAQLWNTRNAAAPTANTMTSKRW